MNLHPGCAKYTTANQAKKYIRRKEAAIVDGNLRFQWNG